MPRVSRTTEAPYAARFGWVCLDLGGPIDWAEIERLVADSYRLVALKRMLTALADREDSDAELSPRPSRKKQKRGR